MENQVLPLLALRGLVIYPGVTTHFEVSRKQSLKALEEAMNREQHIFLVTQRDMMVEEPSIDDLYKIGTRVRILQMVKVSQGVLRVYVEGIARQSLQELHHENDYLEGVLGDVFAVQYPVMGAEEESVFRAVEDSFELFLQRNPNVLSPQIQSAFAARDLIRLQYEIMQILPCDVPVKQAFLEETSVMEQVKKLLVTLEEETEIAEIRDSITQQVKASVDKNQRDYYLREQMKVVRKELGEDESVSEADEFAARCDKLKAPKEVKEKIAKEIRRFKNVPPMQSESIVMHNWIEVMLDMPWSRKSKDTYDIKKAKKVLDDDHYGLEKVKERVLDYLSVKALTRKGETPILCLVGPPGTGKTSIARSIATALNKEYIRLSLGGVHDEAEIRGHRKTYVGSMPGRIADSIKRAGVKNPLMLLDEIDKVSRDHKGDCAAALLEVLDGEQNINFRDHYLEVPLDLSEVFFVATANDPSLIAKPLLDRMEIIELSSYTENEKFHIAEKYLISKQRKANGLKKKDIVITDDAILEIIRQYTREAGVRNLERKIGTLMHKAARHILEEYEGIVVTPDNLEEYLGPALFTEDDLAGQAQVGVARGLAWTSVGGDTLSIEVNVMPGKGQLELTGRMGDVMKESAKIGLSYIRSVQKEYHLEEEVFEKNDIHIHIPEGAVPKDGPSAGITMVTAMLSALTGIRVRGDLAMTGEVTLRGNVLPIGGLKEKLLAAAAVKMKTVLVPAKNKKDVAQLDAEITDPLEIIYVSTMEEVIKEAFLS